MEVKKLKADIEYATCDGVLVMIEGAYPQMFAQYKEYNDKTKMWEHNYKPYDKQDPWGGCMQAKKPPVPEVKVRQFSVDRDGKRIGDGFVTYVKPRDVKGTWTEFLSLYAHKVRERYDAKAEQDRLEHVAKTRQARLQTNLKLGGKGEARISLRKPWHSDKDRRTKVAIYIDLYDEKDLDEFIDSIKVQLHA